jgi:hypothetical protein
MSQELLPQHFEDEQQQRIVDDFDRLEQTRQDQAAFSEHVQAEADTTDNAVDAANLIFDAYRGDTEAEADKAEHFEDEEKPEPTLKEKIEETHKEIDTLVGFLDKRSTRTQTPEEDAQYLELRDKIFGQAGFTQSETKEVLRAWASYRPEFKGETPTAEEIKERQENLADLYRQNITRIADISHKSPGSAAALHRNYGIRNFGRYSERHLLDQHEGRIQEKPVTVALAAAYDWNGFMSERGGISNNLAHIDANEPVITEAATPIEAFRNMLAIKRNFGEIKQIYATAHGDHDSVQFSEGADGVLTSGDIEKSKAIQRLVENGTLTKDVGIILSACYAEKLAQVSSKQTEGQVSATGKELYGGLYTDYKGRLRQERSRSVHTYEQGRRVNGIHRVRVMGRKILEKAGLRLAA